MRRRGDRFNRHLTLPVGSRVSENIALGPARKIQLGADRQKVEACLRQCGSTFARQHGVELIADCMKMEDIGGGVGELCVAEGLDGTIG